MGDDDEMPEGPVMRLARTATVVALTLVLTGCASAAQPETAPVPENNTLPEQAATTTESAEQTTQEPTTSEEEPAGASGDPLNYCFVVSPQQVAAAYQVTEFGPVEEVEYYTGYPTCSWKFSPDAAAAVGSDADQMHVTVNVRSFQLGSTISVGTEKVRLDDAATMLQTAYDAEIAVNDPYYSGTPTQVDVGLGGVTDGRCGIWVAADENTWFDLTTWQTSHDTGCDPKIIALARDIVAGLG